MSCDRHDAKLVNGGGDVGLLDIYRVNCILCKHFIGNVFCFVKTKGFLGKIYRTLACVRYKMSWNALFNKIMMPCTLYIVHTSCCIPVKWMICISHFNST